MSLPIILIHSIIVGIERTLATNVLNNVQLTEGLLPVLRQSKDARIIFVSSGGGLTEALPKSDAEYEQKGAMDFMFFSFFFRFFLSQLESQAPLTAQSPTLERNECKWPWPSIILGARDRVSCVAACIRAGQRLME